jgi:hypothetical protein
LADDLVRWAKTPAAAIDWAGILAEPLLQRKAKDAEKVSDYSLRK